MNLKNYYKSHVYDYAYNKGYDNSLKKDPHPTGDQHDIYWQDEMDYCIIADYYSSFVGGKEDWKEEDKRFLEGFGFTIDDIEEEE